MGTNQKGPIPTVKASKVSGHGTGRLLDNTVGQITYPPPKTCPCPHPWNLWIRATRGLAAVIKSMLLRREIISDYLCGPKVIINLLIRGKVRVREENTVVEKEVRVVEERPQAKDCGHL